MIHALFLTVFPTLFFFLLLPKIGIAIRSMYLRISFAWLTGFCIFTACTFFIAVGLSSITDYVLAKAVFCMLIITELSLLFFAKDIGKYALIFWHEAKKKKLSLTWDTLLVLLCFAFALAFYLPQLYMQNNIIYTSPIYWDFHWHANLIQNFVYGDNFPVQNEAFGGVTHTYHYLWGVATAMYVTCGLRLVDAINTISILGLFFLLLGVIGFVEEVFNSKFQGVIALLLMLTSSSLHFISFIGSSPAQIISYIQNTTNHPFAASFIHNNLFGYQGIMFNMFYFLEERQLLLGALYLICASWILYTRAQYSKKLLFFMGMLLGGFFLWHLYVTIMIGAALVFLLCFSPHKKHSLLLLGGFGFIFVLHSLYFKSVIASSPWFYGTINLYPRINVSFAKGNGSIISLSQFFIYYIFSYGIKIIFLFSGISHLWKKNKSLLMILLGIIIPSFILVNTVQLSPADISENHKWLRPLNIIIDIISAYAFVTMFPSFKKLLFSWRALSILLLLTVSGLLELYPFLTSRPVYPYALYPSELTQSLQEKTKPQALISGFDISEIGLAGRALFLGQPLGGDMNLKVDKRKEIIFTLYTASDKKTFCKNAQSNRIDYVEFDSANLPGSIASDNTKTSFVTHNNLNQEVTFINVRAFCKN